jgi:TRAP transporter TAXI family solute receptor
MSKITTSSVRTWATLIVTLLLVASLVAWFVRRDRLPPTIRIATGAESGLYHKVGTTIAASLQIRLGRKVDVLETAGSARNFRRLNDNEADLAIVQGGSVPLEDVSVVTPLFREFVFVIVRKQSDIQSVWQLEGKRVSLGEIGSGNRDAALKVLRHFGIDESGLAGDNDLPFTAIADDRAIDAAIVTAGIEHPSLKRLMSTGEYDIVPIRSAMAMEMVHPFVRNVEVPRGLFAEHPAVPIESIPTIATTAYLVCQNDAPGELVDAVLGTIHEESLRLKVPTLIARGEATKWTATRMHPTAQRYFNPEDNIGVIVGVMESLVATKELLFAIGAGIYLLWIRWRQLKEKEQQVAIDRQKEHLDRLLTRTLDIEKSQMRSENYEQLQGYLDSVTEIKLQALQELTEEELRGNQSFSILLDQCANLISKIQFKIHLCRSNEHPEKQRS